MINDKRRYMNIAKCIQLLSGEVTFYTFDTRQSFLCCFWDGIKLFRKDFQKFLSRRSDIKWNILRDFLIQPNMISVIMCKQHSIARLTVKNSLYKCRIIYSSFRFAVRKICSKIYDNTIVFCSDFRCASANLMAPTVNREPILPLIHTSLPFSSTY